jgi:ketosteroid isomerase-like protein
VSDSPNAEIVRGLYEAWSRDDYATALASIDPEIEIERADGLAQGTYRGHAGLYQLLEDFWRQFYERRAEIVECVARDDDVVVSVRFHGRGKVSGAQVEMWHWQVWTLRDGKAVRWRIFGSRRQAFETAGMAD